MTRKALIVGISHYHPAKVNLPSSVIEGKAWQSLLLDCYDFLPGDIELLDDSNAFKSAILQGLNSLLGNAEPDDQRVFIFIGHGERDYWTDASALEDEALVALPAGATNVRDIAIFDRDLAALYADMAVPPGVRSTFIFDCCYSGGFEFDGGAHVRKVRVPAGDDGVNFLRFGLRLADLRKTTPPLVIAAARAFEEAIELDGARPRTLFSSLAIAALRENPRLTYGELLAAIAPQMKFAQEPSIRDGDDRIQRQFLG